MMGGMDASGANSRQVVVMVVVPLVSALIGAAGVVLAAYVQARNGGNVTWLTGTAAPVTSTPAATTGVGGTTGTSAAAPQTGGVQVQGLAMTSVRRQGQVVVPEGSGVDVDALDSSWGQLDAGAHTDVDNKVYSPGTITPDPWTSAVVVDGGLPGSCDTTGYTTDRVTARAGLTMCVVSDEGRLATLTVHEVRGDDTYVLDVVVYDPDPA